MSTADALLAPPTPTAALALETVRAMADPGLVNHCLRSYAWGVARADALGLDYDAELLFVSSMLHDLGVVPLFDSHDQPFEDAGGAVGWVFAAGAGWPADRRERVREVIQRHMLPSVDPADDPEGHLLEVATSFDVRGAGADGWAPTLVADVLRRAPRLDFGDRFTGLIAAQARRKPASQARRLHDAGGPAAGAAYWASAAGVRPEGA
ncbi:cyanamide hydratase [Frondihabitans australicus]|uniref:HD domain-containing protein n=1 Tax=Frondihabitans australicus TaxID=386892 RepID=A0A495ICE4_9MICO|nr:cyanamide hydratase [Frondihabitans australicus]RKR72971.1 hypothetical protein C8E83_0053 [Frondihabitans australicus]